MNKQHEKNKYNDPHFPFEIYRTDITGTFPEGHGFNDLHWHEELQFTLIKSGEVCGRLKKFIWIHPNKKLLGNIKLLH